MAVKGSMLGFSRPLLFLSVLRSVTGCSGAPFSMDVENRGQDVERPPCDILATLSRIASEHIPRCHGFL